MLLLQLLGELLVCRRSGVSVTEELLCLRCSDANWNTQSHTTPLHEERSTVKIALNPDFPFRILSHSLGDKIWNGTWVWGYCNSNIQCCSNKHSSKNN